MKTEFLRLVSLGVMVWVGPFAWSQPAQPESRKPGEKRTVTLPGGVKMEFAWCPPGSFLMGSPPTETGRHESETQHQVDITKGYWLGVTEVTQAQWKAVMGTNPSHLEGDDLPVETVSWMDAQNFCSELKKRSGLEVRLPTEAEWEYACRAGTKSAYGFWDNARILGDYAWFGDNSNGQTRPVGKKKPNGWGLYDMHGNVLEWCSDWYGDYPVGKTTDPTGPKSGSYRVIRGGGCSTVAEGSRVASRSWLGPGSWSDGVGFRLAASPSALK